MDNKKEEKKKKNNTIIQKVIDETARGSSVGMTSYYVFEFGKYAMTKDNPKEYLMEQWDKYSSSVTNGNMMTNTYKKDAAWSLLQALKEG